MRMIGTLLITSLIIFPTLTSMRVCKRFRSVVLCSSLLSVVCFLSGLIFSYLYATPTGASIVVANLLAFLLFSAIGVLLGRRKT